MAKTGNSRGMMSAIEKALRCKGFTKNAARKTAKMTVRKSIAKQQLMAERSRDLASDWKKTISAEQTLAGMATKRAAALHDQAAINKPSTMAGKIVVIPLHKEQV